MKTKELLKEIKNLYYQNKDAINPEPKYSIICSIIFVLFAATLIITELVYLVSNKTVFTIIFVVIFILFLIMGIVNFIIEIHLKSFHKKKIEDIRTICQICIDEVARAHNTNEKDLVIYMLNNYKVSNGIRYLTIFISCAATGMAVYYLPGFDKEQHSWFVFLLLVIANVSCSVISSYIIKQINQLDSFQFFVKEPYTNISIK